MDGIGIIEGSLAGITTVSYVAIGIALIVSFALAIYIYMTCKSTPGNPSMQFLSLMIFPFLTFCLISFVFTRPYIYQECDENNPISVFCIDEYTLNEIKESPEMADDGPLKMKIEKFIELRAQNHIIRTIPHSQVLAAFVLCVLVVPFGLLIVSRLNLSSH